MEIQPDLQYSISIKGILTKCIYLSALLSLKCSFNPYAGGGLFCQYKVMQTT